MTIFSVHLYAFLIAVEITWCWLSTRHRMTVITLAAFSDHRCYDTCRAYESICFELGRARQ